MYGFISFEIIYDCKSAIFKYSFTHLHLLLIIFFVQILFKCECTLTKTCFHYVEYTAHSNSTPASTNCQNSKVKRSLVVADNILCSDHRDRSYYLYGSDTL